MISRDCSSKLRQLLAVLTGLVIALSLQLSVQGQKKFVDPQTARMCGCTLRKWPLLGDYLEKTFPSLTTIQPETIIPHYVDAGCGTSPRIPDQGVYGEVRYSSLASLDLFIDHDWHDTTFFVKLNGAAYYLNSDANERNNNSYLCYNQTDRTCSALKDEAVMEIEWDTQHYPERFWATAGDSVWMIGRYIWDCAHPDGYHSEIHSPKAIALTRLEPYVFPGDDSPSLTNKTYVYLNGKSGVKNYSFKTVAGVESVVFNGYKDVDVANQVYEFDVPMPKKPAGYSGQPFSRIVDLPYGGPSPELTIASDQQSVRVRYPLALGDKSPDRKYAAIIASGWRAPIRLQNFRKLIVHIERLQIRKSHNVISQSDWKLWLNINGQWTKLEGLPETTTSLPFGLPNIGRLLSTEIPPLTIEKDFRVIVPDTEEARLTIQVSGWVDVYDSLFGAREDILQTLFKLPGGTPQVLSQLSTSQGRIGIFLRQYSRANNFGVGEHNSVQGDFAGELSRQFEQIDGRRSDRDLETTGDFAIAYSIRETP